MEHTATYSPEDNKLRLYPACRLSPDEYNRVRAAGFIWAPKQELFVAPTWTPEREDLLLEMCGEIGDEDTSLVDRAEAKAERLEDLSARKADEANRAHAAVSAIADNIPLGQPILVGHHSEKHARKDAERIQSGMRRAVDCWKASGYWKERAQGALRLAKYKERPDVRARRIKGIEADLRKADREQGIALMFIKLWSHEPITWPYVKRITNDHRCSVSRCYTLAEFPRELPRKQYEGEMSLWSALGDSPEEGVITAEQARDIALPSLRRRAAQAERWIAHYQHRLDYERAMLNEGGGLIAEQHELKIGGRVRIGAEWLTILRINKKDGKAVSVRTTRRYVPVMGIEEIKGYEAPSEETAAKVADAMKLAPLCNYPGDGFATCTDAEWKAINSDYRGSVTIQATDSHAAHRVRHAIGFRLHLPAPTGKELEPGFCSANRTHAYWPVFVTDAKLKEPPRKGPAPLPESLDAVTDSMFQHSEETGKIRAGIKWTTSTDGPGGECYQFDTLAELIECARAYQKKADMMSFSLVTHSGQYKNMRTVFTWKQPEPDPFTPIVDQEQMAARLDSQIASNRAREEREQAAPAPKLEFNQDVQFTRATAADFEAMAASLRAGVKIVVAPQLFPTPPDLAARMVEAAKIEPHHRVLEPSAGTGNLLRAIGPGPDKVAVEINQQLLKPLAMSESGLRVYSGDFLEEQPDVLGQFDRVVMNPPFQNGADIRHIEHALTFLKPGGRLVALCANGPKQQLRLRALAERSGGWWEDLPAGSFSEQGTNVNVALLVIRK